MRLQNQKLKSLNRIEKESEILDTIPTTGEDTIPMTGEDMKINRDGMKENKIHHQYNTENHVRTSGNVDVELKKNNVFHVSGGYFNPTTKSNFNPTTKSNFNPTTKSNLNPTTKSNPISEEVSSESRNYANENVDIDSRNLSQESQSAELNNSKTNVDLNQGETNDSTANSSHPWDSIKSTEENTTDTSNLHVEEKKAQSRNSFASDPVGFFKTAVSSAKLFQFKSNLPNLSVSNSLTISSKKSPSTLAIRNSSKNIIVPWIEQENNTQEKNDHVLKTDSDENAASSSFSFIPSQLWSYLSFWFSSSSPKVEPLPKAETSSTLKPVTEIKKIVIIGVHGWFPNKMLQRVLGEPIGTSSLFAKKMETAIVNYFEQLNIQIDPALVTVVPLEGGGKIFDRVTNLYDKLITTAIDQVKEADFVVFSAHSQGSPVSALILQRLIKEGIVNTETQRTAILAMAGISHGPFPSLKNSVIIQYVETEQAKELFDFNDPASRVSDAYMMAMKDILECGCKYVAIGSWYDQVVPLYSATLQGVNHVNLYRALYIDEKDYQPDFLSHLLAFALKLRNLGLSDHGLCIHLSDALAGSIYGFGTQGHSAVYEEDQTYTLGVTWALHSPYKKTSSTKTLNPSIEKRPDVPILSHFHAPSKLNPYYLPWIWAHLSMDPVIVNNQSLRAELEMIKSMFLRWTPTASHLKEIKYRLEPIKSKL